MFRQARTTIATFILTGLVGTGLVAGALGSPANAAPPRTVQPRMAKAAPFSLTWNADATTTVKKLGNQVAFPTTGFSATIKPKNKRLSGPLVLPPATTTLKLGRLDVVHITMEVADPSTVAGKIAVDGSVWTITATQSFSVRITRLTGPGKLVNLVRSGCGTARTTATLTGTVDFGKVGQPGGPGDYTMSGSYPIPEFTGCGALMNSLLTQLVSGPDNPLAVHFTS